MTSQRDAVAECAAVIAANSKSFHLASRLLPPDVRARAVVVYAWCRRADDAVDERPPAEQPAALARLLAELDAVYEGDADDLGDDLVLRAFQQVVRERRMPRHYPAELLEGMRWDVAGQRYPDIDTLLRYCWYVAGTVGLMMSHVMGVRRDAALRNAAHLGMAMQLTNICRDVAEDWGRGRLYLPGAWLAEAGGAELLAGVGVSGALPSAHAPACAAVVARMLTLADTLYASGDEGLADLDTACAASIRAARWVYWAIGDVLRRRDCDVTQGRAVVSTRRKLALVARAVAEQARASLREPRTGAIARVPARSVRYPEDIVTAELLAAAR